MILLDNVFEIVGAEFYDIWSINSSKSKTNGKKPRYIEALNPRPPKKGGGGLEKKSEISYMDSRQVCIRIFKIHSERFRLILVEFIDNSVSIIIIML